MLNGLAQEMDMKKKQGRLIPDTKMEHYKTIFRS